MGHLGADEAAALVYVLVTLVVSYLCGPLLGSVLCYVSLMGWEPEAEDSPADEAIAPDSGVISNM